MLLTVVVPENKHDVRALRASRCGRGWDALLDDAAIVPSRERQWHH